jgi:hypothetical protein
VLETLASDLAASGQCQRARFVTEVARLLPKGLEVIDPAFVDLGMVAAAYQLVFFETEYAAFELAGYRHRSGSCSATGTLSAVRIGAARAEDERSMDTAATPA